jgi:SAM-dependent methyltransferase
VYTRSAPYYDALYAFKDYEGTARRLQQLLGERHPGARTLLDVACGTARHLELLRQRYRVEGVDLSEELLQVARARCPDVPLHRADMADFDLGRTFDVVTCLFSSIAYVRSLERMRAATEAMARHVAPGGLLLLEPWFPPERYWTGTITANFVDRPDLKIAWMYTSDPPAGRLAVLDISYLVGTVEGVEHFEERHELGLFTDEEHRQAFRDAGLEVEHDETGIFGRGMYLGRRS